MLKLLVREFELAGLEAHENKTRILSNQDSKFNFVFVEKMMLGNLMLETWFCEVFYHELNQKRQRLWNLQCLCIRSRHTLRSCQKRLSCALHSFFEFQIAIRISSVRWSRIWHQNFCAESLFSGILNFQDFEFHVHAMSDSLKIEISRK